MIRENLKLSDYLFKTTGTSKIDPTKTILISEELRCPNCKVIHTLLRSQNKYGIKCNCGLLYRIKGGSIQCTLEDKDLIIK